MNTKKGKRKQTLKSLPGQIIVEPDLEELGEIESKTEGGIIKPAQVSLNKPSIGFQATPITGIVVATGNKLEPNYPQIGDTVVFDKACGLRFEHNSIVYVSLYDEMVRAFYNEKG